MVENMLIKNVPSLLDPKVCLIQYYDNIIKVLFLENKNHIKNITFYVSQPNEEKLQQWTVKLKIVREGHSSMTCVTGLWFYYLCTFLFFICISLI